MSLRLSSCLYGGLAVSTWSGGAGGGGKGGAPGHVGRHLVLRLLHSRCLKVVTILLYLFNGEDGDDEVVGAADGGAREQRMQKGKVEEFASLGRSRI